MKKVLKVMLALMLVCGLASGVMAKEMKIGYADKMKILFDYEKTKQLNKELEDESAKARADVDKMSEEIRKLNDEMQLLSESARKEKQPELDNKIKALDDLRRAKTQELTRKQDEGVRNITKEITTACEAFAKAKGYDVLIDIRATLFTPPADDVTEAIIVELNKK